MKRRIFLSLVLIALISAVIAMLVTGFFYFGEYEKRARFDLRQQLSAAAEGYRTGGEAYIRSLRLDSRITLIEEDGDVVYDSKGSASDMKSHADRQEFIDAELSGTGTSERRSETMGIETMYEAELLPDGRVLRMSVDIESLTYSFRTSVFFVLLIFIPFCFLLLLAAELITRRLAGPISRIDLDRPLDSNVYPELYPLLSKISGQNRKIELQLRELSTRQSVIRTVTSNMREGVIFTDPDQIILLSNGEARNFLQAIGEDPDAPRILDTMKGIGALEGRPEGRHVKEAHLLREPLLRGAGIRRVLRRDRGRLLLHHQERHDRRHAGAAAPGVLRQRLPRAQDPAHLHLGLCRDHQERHREARGRPGVRREDHG